MSTRSTETSTPPAGGVAVTAHCVHVPGAGDGPEAAAPAGDAAARAVLAAAEPACGPDQAHTVLGRKGLLFKEPATRLALCAVHRALGLPPGRLTEPLPGAGSTAVVVSSNLGNVQTVRDVAATMRAGSAHDVSPLNGPNASSNVIASTIAIRYGFTGPNLMVCSGATSGLDAVRLGSLLLHGGRARRVVVVGVEPDDEVAAALAGLREEPAPAGGLRAAAACLVLEPRGPGTDLLLGPVRHHARPDDHPQPAAGALRLVPPGAGGPSAVDVSAHLGDTYGALGVLQLALAASWLTAGDRPDGPDGPGGDHPDGERRSALVTCGDAEDGYASVRLGRVRVPVPAGRA
ncbi:hypothetical protein GCM10010406_27350 [Streptomyces thermolineatus]|uniref:Beta-ketoacyl synthase-like N-terminal domain-containing protein n=1 Tax=Streptomyces thermolineatus TaxID=44033 RepID=A0ABP5YZK9_9ACTN